MSLWPKPLLNRVVDQRIMISLVYKIYFINRHAHEMVGRAWHYTLFYSSPARASSVCPCGCMFRTNTWTSVWTNWKLTSLVNTISTHPLVDFIEEEKNECIEVDTIENIGLWLDWWYWNMALNNYQSRDAAPIIIVEWWGINVISEMGKAR